MIEKDERILILRYISYGKYDFLKEHQLIINEAGSVWVFKMGMQISQSSAKKVIANGSHLLLRQPKNEGGKFYYFKILGFMNGIYTKDMIFPDYYYNDKQEQTSGRIEGAWFKIDQMIEVPEKFYNHFRMINNDRLVTEVIYETRTPVLYAYSDKDLAI